MENEIKCPKCGSINIKKIEGADDFLSHKDEGEPVKRQTTKTKQKYVCLKEKCNYEWEDDLLKSVKN
jgi:transposase-like protein